MAIKRIIASADNTITNAFKGNLTERGTAANMGESDILEVFSIYAQASTSSIEKSRILIQFPIDKIQALRAASQIPAAGSPKFFLNLYNTPHGQTVPEKYYLNILPSVRPWEEGYGLDMESYLNEGPSNWVSASADEIWQSQGGDYTDSSYISSSNPLPLVAPELRYVTGAVDNVHVDITEYVEEWLKTEAGTAAPANTEFNFLKAVPEGSKVKLYSANSVPKVYKFVSSGALVNKNISTNSSKEVEVRLGDNNIIFTSAVPGDYNGKIISINDGTAVVQFAAQDRDGAGALKVDATHYQWDTEGLASANAAAVAFHAALALAITNTDINLSTTAPGAAETSVVINQGSAGSITLTSANDWTNIATITTGQVATITHFREALTSSLGHSGSILANQYVGSTILQLTQSRAGYPGNTFLSKSIDSLPNTVLTFGKNPQRSGTSTLLSERAFTGGVGLYNAGLGIHLSGSYETGAFKRSYYTKKFFARGSEFVLKRPNIEIQWDSTLTDDRGYLVTTSAHRTDASNKQVIYFYNWVNGILADLNSAPTFALTTDIALTEKVTMEPGGAVVGVDITTAKVSGTTGIYKAEFEISSTITVTTLYEKWWIGAENVANLLKGHSGNSPVEVRQWYTEVDDASAHAGIQYFAKITNLKHTYEPTEQARFRVFVRNKNISQNIYTIATKELAAFPIKNGYFQIKRIPDDLVVVAYSTGSVNYSGLSYDKDGNYFDLDMSLLEPGYSYEISFLRISGGITKEMSNKFKFRVD